MALKLEDKKAIVAEVSDVANSSVSAIAAEYRGLTVAEMTELRNKARQSDIYMRVVRNTLAQRALENTEYACLNSALVGPLVLLFARKDPGAAARLLRDFGKDHDKLVVKALALGGKLLGAESLKAVADLPTREQALGMLASVLIAPITKLARTLAEPQNMLARAVAAVRDQKQAA
ncbi:MAG: 50S ribosomal protein L10 [Coxiellaceae bacterium]|nr:MAG: 50S ribosomal protein L10 [Coxiellaceae bacterium]